MSEMIVVSLIIYGVMALVYIFVKLELKGEDGFQWGDIILSVVWPLMLLYYPFEFLIDISEKKVFKK